jgi:hypothetical protein
MKKKHAHWMLAFLVAGALTAATAAERTQEKGGTDDFGPYQPVAGWLKLKPLNPGQIDRGCSVFVESQNRIWYTTDAEFPAELPRQPYVVAKSGDVSTGGQTFQYTHIPRVLLLDADGNVIEEWKQWEHLLNMPHRITISPYDPEKSVWIVDRDNSQIFKFSHDGKKLLMTLGEKGVIKSDDTHFGRPADIGFLPDGSFLVADGYDNTRIIKFDKNGKRLATWGTKGNGPGQFKVQVHDVAVDQRGRIYVGDRGNDRVQIFDADGKYLDEWDNISRPSFIWVTKDGYVWVVAGTDNRIAKYDMGGKLLTSWGVYGVTQGKFDDPHDLSVDAAGNLYVSMWSLKKIGLEKFVPNPNADPRRLVHAAFDRSLSAATDASTLH